MLFKTRIGMSIPIMRSFKVISKIMENNNVHIIYKMYRNILVQIAFNVFKK